MSDSTETRRPDDQEPPVEPPAGPRKATLQEALIPTVITIIMLLAALFFLEADAHIPLIIGGCIVAFMALRMGYTWKELESTIINSISLSMPACLILMSVGLLIGGWLASGIVPTMIYFGLQIINPAMFLVVAFLLCCITSLAIGTSWGTASTVGVALIGIAYGLGIPPAMAAGAVVGGAFFGDKISPLSDTTNLNAISSGVPLFDHIRFMLPVTIPATILAVALYFALGMQFGGDHVGGDIPLITATLRENFNISPILLIPPLFIIVIIALKVPPLPGILAGAFISVPAFYIFQAGVRFDNMLDATIHLIASMHYGFRIDTDMPTINRLLNRGGLDSKMWAISIVFCSMFFGGMMEKTGSLAALTQGMIRFAKGTGSLVLTSLFGSLFANMITADQYLAIILPGRMFRKEYIIRGYHPKMLARTLEGGGTLSSPLIPWNACGAFIAVTLGVPTLQLLPFAFFNLISFALIGLFGIFQISVSRITEEEKAELLAMQPEL